MSDLPIGRVVCGDACEVLSQFPDGRFDLCIADPPYGLSAFAITRVRTVCGVRQDNGQKVIGNAGGDYGEEDREAADEWVKAVARVLRPGGCVQVFCAQRQWQRFRDVAEKSGLMVRNCWYWCKTSTPPTPRDNFASAVEMGWWFYKPGGPVTWNGGHCCPNWWSGSTYHGTFASGGRIHPMQKPEWLLDEFMRLWTNPGDTVLDLFSGSATTSVCAVRSGCEFVAVEKDPAHAANAQARVDRARSKLSAQPQLLEA